MILPVARDVDDPLFFRSKADSDGKVNTGIEIEEDHRVTARPVVGIIRPAVGAHDKYERPTIGQRAGQVGS